MTKKRQTQSPSKGAVLIGYLDNGHWSACFGLSLRDLYLHDLSHSQRMFRGSGGELRKMSGAMGIATGRNDIVRTFLDNHTAEWLFFIDTDMGFAPDTIDQLIVSAEREKAEMMGGLCFAGIRDRRTRAPYHAERIVIQPTVYEYVELDDEVGFRPIVDYKRDAVVPVGATGAACLLLRRSALEKVRERYEDEWFTPITHPTALKGKPRTFSEDLSLCVRLAALGIQPFVDTGVKTTHEKGFLFLDEETFDIEQSTLKEKTNG